MSIQDDIEALEKALEARPLTHPGVAAVEKAVLRRALDALKESRQPWQVRKASPEEELIDYIKSYVLQMSRCMHLNDSPERHEWLMRQQVKRLLGIAQRVQAVDPELGAVNFPPLLGLKAKYLPEQLERLDD